MGFRTALVLNNDCAHEWEKDPELGRKIWLSSQNSDRYPFRYGSIIQQVHADCQTLAILDGYHGKAVVSASWHSGKTDEQRDLELLKAFADKLGYRVVKKPTK